MSGSWSAILSSKLSEIKATSAFGGMRFTRTFKASSTDRGVSLIRLTWFVSHLRVQSIVSVGFVTPGFTRADWLIVLMVAFFSGVLNAP
jgi:hypothetical protein